MTRYNRHETADEPPLRLRYMYMSIEELQAERDDLDAGDAHYHEQVIAKRRKPVSYDADSQDKSDFVRRIEDRMGLD